MMMILSSLLIVLSLSAPTLCKPATIISGFGVDEMMKEAQKQQEQVKTVDSSQEVGGVVDGSTEDSASSEVHTTLSPPGTIHVGPDTIVKNGREHIHDPEHGNDDVIIDHKMQKVQMFGGEDVEIGGNSEMPKSDHVHHHKQPYNPDAVMEKQEFKKGWAPTEILWSPSIMANGYNGGVRRPDYRHFVAAQRH